MLAKYSDRSANILIKLSGYNIKYEIYTGSRTRVFQGIREADNKPVIIKLISAKYPTFDEVAQFRHQYAILKSLDITGVVKAYSLEVFHNGYALIMEDFGGVSLEQHIETWERTPDTESEIISNFFQIAIAIAEILEEVHKNHIIHKDIKPANILINQYTKDIKLIDFSIASVLAKETSNPLNVRDLEGTLFYLSPEQTGRMNRNIDYRSDFYSLGITFYELLTGELPFQSDDPMEIVHSHIAKQPIKPSAINSQIPSIVDRIIYKLIAKNAEGRYQSASGLKYDLEKCYEEWKSGNNIVDFELCTQDISHNFNIPEKLYGREAEVQRLIAAFERVSQENTEIFLVCGSSGVGKTAVINEVHKPIVQKRGYFIQGKYDQLHREIPFAGFVEAFRDLIRQVLSDSDRHIQEWKNQILQALGEQAQVIVDIVPELEQIIGKQPPAPQLSGIAAQNRFNLLLQRFIHIFARKKHPLVIFIDDLQWADAASLQLIQLLMSESKANEQKHVVSLSNAFDPLPQKEEEGQCLLILGAYRDNEVSLSEPLYITIREMQKIGVKLEISELEPLHQADLNRMVSETLNCDERDSIQLTHLIFNKTKGNPFFSQEFIKSLYKEGLVEFDYKRGHWVCQMSQVRELALTDDVVEFMAQQIARLPIYTQEVLKVAACIGNKFDLHTLAITHQDTEGETASKFWPALKEGIILPTNDGSKLAESTKEIDLSPIDEEESLETNTRFAEYKFAHDRVQQAAYSLLPENEKLQIHLKLAKLLLQNIPLEEREENVFIIVNQFNKAKILIEEPTELRGLANMNLIAGRKAIASTAYIAADNYLTTGIELLQDNSWETDYELTMGLYEAAAEAAYLSSNFDGMDIYIQQVLLFSKTLLEKVKVYEIRIQHYTSQNKLPEAISLGREVLEKFDIIFPKNITESNIKEGLKEVKEILGNKKIEELENLSLMTCDRQLAITRIISIIFPPSYIAEPMLFPLLVISLVKLSFNYGNCFLSAFIYANYGMLLISLEKDFITAQKFSDLAKNLLVNFNDIDIKTRTSFIIGAFISHTNSHIRHSLPILIEGYKLGLEIGNFEFLGYCAKDICQHSYFIGENLYSLKNEIINYNIALLNVKQTTTYNYCHICLESINTLQIISYQDSKSQKEICDQDKLISNLVVSKDITGLHQYYLHQLIIHYLLDNLSAAQDNSSKCKDNLSGGTGFITTPIFYFYDSLTILASFSDSQDKNNFIENILENQTKLKEWAHHAPMNYLHKYELVEAELHRVLNNKLEAIEYYDRAIVGAKDNEYINEEALANELAAKFYLGWGKEKIAQTYMNEAYYCYSRWGAKAKVNHLREHYPELLKFIIQQEEKPNLLSINNTIYNTFSNRNTIKNIVTSSTNSISESLDLATVIKASQALAGEIDLEQLLSTILKVVMENAGASKCALILKNEEDVHFQVSAVCSINEEDNSQNIYFPSEKLDVTKDVPVSVINYVRRVQETYLIGDVIAEQSTSRDRYIIERQPKCIVCLPLMHQGKLISILYLENKWVKEVFTNESIEILKLIATQAAIFIENASLYKNLEKANKSLAAYNQSLEKQVAQRTEELQKKNKFLQKTLQKLQNAQAQLIQNEKMSSLGQMIAGIAHEINNPINFIHGNINHTSQYVKDLLDLIAVYQHEYPDPKANVIDKQEEIDLDFVTEDLQKTIDSMKLGSLRIRNIVLSLRNFSRLDESEMKHVDIHEGIDNTLMILQHRLKAKEEFPEIKVIKEYSEIPKISCFAGQLNQVFMNLISNAIDALEESCLKQNKSILEPEIRISTKITDIHQLQISIADNGLGIPEEVKNKIFDPFFTTKPVGYGTGLGLSISYQIIVEKHKGKLSVNSIQEEGTKFLIHIPLE